MSKHPIKIEDYSSKDKIKYKNVHEDAPQWPSRILMTGASGSGKTNCMLNLIYNFMSFDSIYLYARNPDQLEYQDLAQTIEDIAAETGKEITFIFGSKLSDVIPVDELDKSKQNLVVFDDFAGESKKNLEIYVLPFYIRGRHKNCTTFFLSQSYTLCPVNIRRNCNFFMFFGKMNQADSDSIYDDHCGECDKRQFKKVYSNIVKTRFEFFTIDLINIDKKYRHGLSHVVEI